MYFSLKLITIDLFGDDEDFLQTVVADFTLPVLNHLGTRSWELCETLTSSKFVSELLSEIFWQILHVAQLVCNLKLTSHASKWSDFTQSSCSHMCSLMTRP